MGTRVVAGRAGLQRPVTWTALLHTRVPAFPSLEGHELALLTIESLHALSDKLTLNDVIHELAALDAAGVGVVGTIDGRARAAADELGLALLNLPESASLRQVERDVVKVLVGPTPPPEQRGLEIYKQLLQLSTENKGMSPLVAALMDATGATLVVHDKRMEILAAEGPLKSSARWPEIERALADSSALPPSFRDRVEVAQVMPDPITIDLSEFGLRRLVTPIVANRMGRGFFSMLSEGSFDALDFQFARHGADVCALEMAKEKAVREAQKRVQGGIVERLLMGTIPVDQAVRQLVRLGHQPEAHPYIALSACWALPNQAHSERRLEAIFNDEINLNGLHALVQVLEGSVVVFCGDESGARGVPRSIKQLADSTIARAKMQYPNANLVIGIGRPVNKLIDWRSSYNEALAAQRIALQWQIYQPLFFGDLGVYRLLSLLLETPELLSFYRETLGELSDERYANDDFITTLEAFFEEHGNLSQTANKLHVHRNTLLYRMERIAQIGGFDLDNPETRLAVHLALKIRRLVTGSKISGR
jgi:purine catabolism regulator